MTQHEYEAKKRECWEEFLRKHEISRADGVTADVFIVAFGRAYALGKQTETITQEDIEKAAKEYSDRLGKSRDVTWNDGEYGFIAGANFALGKIDGAKEQKERDDHYIEMQKAFARFDKACDGTIHALDKLTNTLDKI